MAARRTGPTRWRTTGWCLFALVATSCTTDPGSTTGSVAGPVDTSTATVPGASVTVAATEDDDTTTASAGLPTPYCAAVTGFAAVDQVAALRGRDPQAARTGVAQARAALDAVAASAPTALSGDWAVVAGAYRQVFDAYSSAGYDFGLLMADPKSAGVLEELGAEGFRTASDRIEAGTESACGVSVGLGDSGDSGEASAPSPQGAVDTAEAAPTIAEAPQLSDASAAEIGSRLLGGFGGLGATTSQKACVGRAVSDPALGQAPAGASNPLDRYRAIVAACGLDPSLIRG